MTPEEAKNNLLQAKARLERAFEHVPEDRLNWSPSPTSRTPIEQVVHAADAIGNIHGWLTGSPFGPKNSTEADRHFREVESRIKTREEALALLEDKSQAFTNWLDAATQEDLDRMATAPFGLGQFPVSFAIQFPALHTTDHAAQMEYMHTIYGDRDWHMGF